MVAIDRQYLHRGYCCGDYWHHQRIRCVWICQPWDGYDVHSAIVNMVAISPSELRIATGAPTVTFFHLLAFLHQYQPRMEINLFFHNVAFAEWDAADTGIHFHKQGEVLHMFWDHILPGQRAVQVALTVPVPGGRTNVGTTWCCAASPEDLLVAVAEMSIDDV